jgi:dTDP-4-amino-4,6-dideoxygalactose transaminase
VFKWTLFPLLYVGTRLGWSIDMYFWEQIRPLDPMPADYRERFSNIQAAIALEGLSHLNEWTSARQKLAGRMTRLLSEIPGVRSPSTPADRTHVYYQYCAYVPSRDAIVDACLRRGIDIETLHVDICTELPIFGPTHAPTPGAQTTQQTIQIPVYESLSISELERVAAVVGDAVIALAAESPRTVPQSP